MLQSCWSTKKKVEAYAKFAKGDETKSFDSAVESVIKEDLVV